MRWTTPVRLNPHKIIHKYHLLDRTMNRHREKMAAAGTPATTFRNTTVDANGKFKNNLTRCYCWEQNEAQPDRNHFLCLGTGYLEGYSKYGYEELIYSTPSEILELSSNIQKTGNEDGRLDTFIISGASLEETIETDRIEMIRFLEIDRFLSKQRIDPEDNRIKYYYNISEPFDNDETNWIEINMSQYTTDNLANMQSESFTIDEGTQYIKFRIKLQKRYTTSKSPKFNSIRFRYRNQKTLAELDPRFDFITIPAFLASREQVREKVEQGQDGWKTTRPISWWTLPEANIEETDVIKFLHGTMEGNYHIVQEVTKYQYGRDLQILHRDFETRFVRDSDDLFGIVHLLS